MTTTTMSTAEYNMLINFKKEAMEKEKKLKEEVEKLKDENEKLKEKNDGYDLFLSFIGFLDHLQIT